MILRECSGNKKELIRVGLIRVAAILLSLNVSFFFKKLVKKA